MLLHQQRAFASEPATSAADLIGKRTLTSRLASTARAPIERGAASTPSVVDVSTDGVGDAPGPLPSSPSAVDGLTDPRLLQRPWLTGAANDEAVGDAPAPATTTASAATTAPATTTTPSSSGAVPPQVLARAGQTFTHYGYTYLITPEGNFTIRSSPTGKGVGTTFKPTGSSAKAWKVLSDYLVAQGPAQPATAPSPAGATAPADPATSGWSVDGVVTAITDGLSALGDAVMAGVAVIEQALTSLLGDDASAAPPATAGPEAEPAPDDSAGAPSQTAPAAPTPGGDVATPGPGALPFVVGGQPSSRAAGTTYPNYGGSGRRR